MALLSFPQLPLASVLAVGCCCDQKQLPEGQAHLSCTSLHSLPLRETTADWLPFCPVHKLMLNLHSPGPLAQGMVSPTAGWAFLHPLLVNPLQARPWANLTWTIPHLRLPFQMILGCAKLTNLSRTPSQPTA